MRYRWLCVLSWLVWVALSGMTAEATQAAGRTDNPEILLLYSYEPGMMWTASVDQGLSTRLEKRSGLTLYREYLDVRRYSEAGYLTQVAAFYRNKFQQRQFAAVVAADDAAYNFALRYREQLFPEVPLVFCGVNQAAVLPLPAGVTGVMEVVDLARTVAIARQNHPASRHVWVINDRSDVGRANEVRLKELLPQYSDALIFHFLTDYSAAELTAQLQELRPERDIVLLLTFLQDRRQQRFTYEQSLALVADNTAAPIYGVWDFYLGRGLVGGRLTSGRLQGEAAAGLLLQILDGKAPEELPVIADGSTNRDMFDDRQLRRFHIEAGQLPADSIVIERPVSFVEKYQMLVWCVLAVIVTLCIGILGLYQHIRQRRKLEDELRLHATTDFLTGVINRRTGIELLQQYLKLADRSGQPVTICFIDVNDLKRVNDRQGHLVGDQLIQLVCRVVRQNIRRADVLCRFGGDEFLLIFPACDRAAGLEVWQAIATQLGIINRERKHPFRVSVSYGLAEYQPGSGQTLEALIKEADDAMYEHKKRYKQATQARDD